MIIYGLSIEMRFINPFAIASPQIIVRKCGSNQKFRIF